MWLEELKTKQDIYHAGHYDVLVVGAGHAGCEAAYVSAKLGAKTILFTLSLDALANLPCNPSIGGTAKGQLVREIDALGGIMGKIADQASIQYRMLNRSKGPAVQSPRAQMDRKKYQETMLQLLENTEHLTLRQAEIVDLVLKPLAEKDKFQEEDQVVAHGVLTKTGAYFSCERLILATGTYLDAKIFMGNTSYTSGPDGIAPSLGLADKLKAHGLSLRRFKTGTPVRVNKNSVDFSQMEIQEPDEEPWSFSFSNEARPERKRLPQLPCYLTYTNDETKNVIQANLHRSPLFSGEIEGVGPRYCPSIEDKIVRFADKERHQIFIEPMGLNSNELYVQGLSSSMPEDVQEKMCRSIKGLEQAVIQRSAYAIEYECLDPLSLRLDLSCRGIQGLYTAGQLNGTSGYEEAAAQGLMAGINAVQNLQGKPPFILGRDEAYIGVLIDDLVSKGTKEPYRMMTSRAEYRLLLRHDNADARLTEKGYQLGLVNEEDYQNFLIKMQKIEEEKERLSNLRIRPTDKQAQRLYDLGLPKLHSGISLAELLMRPEMTYKILYELGLNNPNLSSDSALTHLVEEEVEIQLKYKGYIELEEKRIDRFKKMESKAIPEDFEYQDIKGLRIEAKQKLMQILPRSLGQASRISGVSPADISVLLVALELHQRTKKQAN